MNYNPSPKSDFVKDTNRVAMHRKLAADPYLRDALNAALLEYNRSLAGLRIVDIGGAASGFFRFMGAQDLIETFLNLAEKSEAPVTADVINLPSNKPTKTN